jgi:hypothetical protein
VFAPPPGLFQAAVRFLLFGVKMLVLHLTIIPSLTSNVSTERYGIMLIEAIVTVPPNEQESFWLELPERSSVLIGQRISIPGRNAVYIVLGYDSNGLNDSILRLERLDSGDTRFHDGRTEHRACITGYPLSTMGGKR